MAYSTIFSYLKKDIPCNKKTAAIKNYNSADPRVWSNDHNVKSIGLHDILTCDTFPSSDSPEIKNLLDEIKQKDLELDEIHKMYKELSQKLKDLESNRNINKKIIIPSDEIMENSIEDFESVKKRAENYEEILKERNELKKELSKMENVEELLKKLKMRAEEADKMEQEILKLKSDLVHCGHGGSGDKLRIEPTRVNSDSQCIKCREYVAELNESRSMLELRERKCIEMEAERNFLRERTKMIRCMEAEMILYKTKYEECECKMLNLKEALVKAEINERKLRESQCKLMKAEYQLLESEEQNKDLIGKIEQLEMDLKECDVYVDSLKQRLQSDNGISGNRKAIQFDEFVPGKVQSIVKQLSKESPTTCRCNIENCHCAVMSKPISNNSVSSADCMENIVNNENYLSSNCSEYSRNENTLDISPSETDRLKDEISCNEVRLLRQQNSEFNSEICRLKAQLACVSKVLEDIEEERSSNCDLESEINKLKIKHNQELEEVNSTYRSSICQKLSEIQSLEGKLMKETEEKCKLEKRLLESCDTMNDVIKYKNELQELRKSYENLDKCHKKRLCEMEALMNENSKINSENMRLNEIIDELNRKLKELKDINIKSECERNTSRDQRNVIKKSVVDMKKFNAEKTYMIKCYEKKIKTLEAENEGLKCFRDKGTTCYNSQDKFSELPQCDDILFKKIFTFGIDSLDYEELIELHDRVRCALMKITKKASHVDLEINYSKMLDELCRKYNIGSSKEVILDNLPVRDNLLNNDVSSSITFPKTRRTRNRTTKKVRSKSSGMHY